MFPYASHLLIDSLYQCKNGKPLTVKAETLFKVTSKCFAYMYVNASNACLVLVEAQREGGVRSPGLERLILTSFHVGAGNQAWIVNK